MRSVCRNDPVTGAAGTGDAVRLEAERELPGARLWAWLLVGITAVWGWTFVAIHDAVATMHPSAFVAYRFLGAAAVMAVVLLPVLRRMTATELTGGALAGVALFVGYAAQTLGLESTTPSNTAFITGMSVVFTPLLLFIAFRVRPRPRQVVSVLLAAIGLALLTMRGFQVHYGDLLVLGCAIAFAAHVITLSRVSALVNPARLTFVQLATVGVLALAWSGLTDNLTRPANGDIWVALAVCAVVASAFAYFVQTKAQAANVSPTRVALIFALEPVFGGFFGYWLAGDRFTTLNFVGAGLILAAMLLTELQYRPKSRNGTVAAG
ncbi:DMT family transporter [Saccharothrix isguenensis]